MRQLQLFTTAELARMRDRTRSRNYSPERDEFRRAHERRRAWGLARRHAEKLRRLHDRSADPLAATSEEDRTPDPSPDRMSQPTCRQVGAPATGRPAPNSPTGDTPRAERKLPAATTTPRDATPSAATGPRPAQKRQSGPADDDRPRPGPGAGQSRPAGQTPAGASPGALVAADDDVVVGHGGFRRRPSLTSHRHRASSTAPPASIRSSPHRRRDQLNGIAHPFLATQEMSRAGPTPVSIHNPGLQPTALLMGNGKPAANARRGTLAACCGRHLVFGLPR